MANVKYFSSFSHHVFPELFDDSSFRLRETTNTEMIFADKYGASVTVEGAHFTYSHGKITGGVIQSVRMVDSDGSALVTIKHGHIDAVDVQTQFHRYGIDALYWVFGDNNDVVRGTVKDDNFDAGSGDDLLICGDGDDWVFGNSGTDTIFGGNGSDKFVFARGYDVDILADFDEGGGHDRIRLQRDMWHQMDKHQDGGNVVLDFGLGDTIIIEHAKAADITKNDFSLY